MLAVAASLVLAGAAPATVGAAGREEALKIFKSKACGACHIIPGVPNAYGTLGPSLKGLNNRARIAAGRLENTRENLREWLKNPLQIKPDTMMPSFGLEDAEVELLLKFLDKL